LIHFLYGNNHELYIESLLSKKTFWPPNWEKRQVFCHSEGISVLQKMSFWGDFSTSIYVILGRFLGKNKKSMEKKKQ
jgi:hypothetical protein